MALTPHDYATVCALFATPLSDRAISRQTGVSQGTVSRWRRSPSPPKTIRRAQMDAMWGINDPGRYCYLLGAYLGDGTVFHHRPNYWDLRIVNDRKSRGVSREILDSMRTTFPGAPVGMCASPHGESDILHVAHPAVWRAFPQHGPGRKHERTIELSDWQLDLTRGHPGALIRGLIHSDGCRTLNSFITKLPSGRAARYSYVRYFFTNHSADIRAIFTEHCELLGVRVTQPNARNLAISHRTSVAILEELVGAKS